MGNIIYKNISKKFESKLVLKDINLTIQPNQVYCILGRNGAGKSTLINIACNIIKADTGTIMFDDQTYSNKAIDIYKSIGLQSQYDILIEELNTYDYLQFIGRIYNMNKADIASQIALFTSYFLKAKQT